MPRLVRHLRRPVILLPLLYSAGVWVLAETMGPQPWVQVNVNVDADRRYEFVGLSPDGNAVATHQYLQRSKSGWSQSRAYPDTIWVWELTVVAQGERASPTAHESP